MPNGCRSGKTAPVWGTKAKPPVSPKPRRLCCPVPSHTPMALAQTLWSGLFAPLAREQRTKRAAVGWPRVAGTFCA